MSFESQPIIEKKQKTQEEQNLEPVEAFVEKNPQIIDGKLRYVVSGSTTIILFAEAKEIKTYTVDNEGNLTMIEEESVGEKTKAYLRENLSKFGTPSDIDISFTSESSFPEKSIVEDEFILQDGEKILVGNIGGKEYYFENPLSYIVKFFSNRYLGFSMKDSINEKYRKLAKMETVLESLLQDISIEVVVEEIGKTIQESPKKQTPSSHMLLGDSERQMSIAGRLLEDPHGMYRLMTQSTMKSGPDGHLDASININRFPHVKELINMLSARYSNNVSE